jgi:hypothetical protein
MISRAPKRATASTGSSHPATPANTTSSSRRNRSLGTIFAMRAYLHQLRLVRSEAQATSALHFPGQWDGTCHAVGIAIASRVEGALWARVVPSPGCERVLRPSAHPPRTSTTCARPTSSDACSAGAKQACAQDRSGDDQRESRPRPAAPQRNDLRERTRAGRSHARESSLSRTPALSRSAHWRGGPAPAAGVR